MKRSLCLLLCLMMLVGVLPLGGFAADGTPFTDVMADSWYEDAVVWCYENQYMSGTSATTFAPAGQMTRAMFATVLCAVAGVDKDEIEYKGSFTDVPDGQWYTAAVEWAAENGIVSGIGNGLFGTTAPVTRETIVLMTYKFMQYTGADTSLGVREKSLLPFGDLDSLHDWAEEAMTWAVSREMISGTAVVDGTPMLSPVKSATRAEVAVILKKVLGLNFESEYPIGQLLLGGVDISQFDIVYGETGYIYRARGRSDAQKKENAIKAAREVAESLAEYIEKLTGVSLDIYADTELAPTEGAYEILIGKTNREEAGLVTVDREGIVGDALIYEMQGNYLILASDEQYAGTFMARNRFLENVLGLHYFAPGIESYESMAVVDFKDGERFTDSPDTEYLCNYAYNGSDLMLCHSETYLTFGNAVHSIPVLNCRGDCEHEHGDDVLNYDHHVYHHKDPDPCLSDSDNIRTIIENVKKVIAAKPEEKLIWLSQSDGVYYCKCSDCAAIYRTFGRCATYAQLMQYVGEAIAEEYPEHKLVGLAYKYTMRAPNVSVSDEDYAKFLEGYTEEEIVPKQDITCPANTIMMICTDNACASCALDDPTCTNVSNSNVRFSEYVDRWSQIMPALYVWDYVDGPGSTPFPNILEYHNNYKYFAEHGVNGLFSQASTRNYADFAELRTFLISRIAWDMKMSDAEYSNTLNSFLEAYYGQGWTYIRRYIDRMEELSSENEWHIWSMGEYDDVLTIEQWHENLDELCEYWQNALKLAETSQQRGRITHTYATLRTVAGKLD